MSFYFSKKNAQNFVKESYQKMYNIASLKNFSKHLLKKSFILDLGCGGGQDSLIFAQQGHTVTGIDITSEVIRLAKKKVNHPKVTFKKSSFEKFSTSKKFDGIWCAKVFHFIPLEDQNAFIKKVYKILKPGGVFYLTSKTTDKRIDYELNDGEYGTTRKRLTRKTFESILRKNGFQIMYFKYWNKKVGMEIIAKKNIV